MSNPKTVAVISKAPVLTSITKKFLGEHYLLVEFATLRSSLDYIYSSTPDVLLIDMTPDDPRTVTMLNDLKSDPILGHLPVLAVFDDVFAWGQPLILDFNVKNQGLTPFTFIDDYIKRSSLEAEILPRVELCVRRAERMIEVNPLTRLPGNIHIIKQIQKRLDAGERFALAYADLDHFKPYNDRYGFSRGDEVLKMLGRLILNTVKERQAHGSFVGHIGGDDFVFIMEYDAVEETSEKITGYFDRIIPTFYDADDRAKGFIESVDRDGRKKIFPLICLSIGIAHNALRQFEHYGEIAEIASEMKKFAKTVIGSCYKIDKRNL